MGGDRSGDRPGLPDGAARGFAPAYASWRTLDPTLSFAHWGPAGMLELWNRMRGAREMPTREEVRPEVLRGHLGWVSLIDVERDPLRFRFRLVGTSVAAGLSRDSSGKYLDVVYGPEFYDVAIGSYLWILDHRRPLRAYGRMEHALRGEIGFESVDLPFSTDGRTIDMILKRTRFEGYEMAPTPPA